jgi:hypothetical protein
MELPSCMWNNNTANIWMHLISSGLHDCVFMPSSLPTLIRPYGSSWSYLKSNLWMKKLRVIYHHIRNIFNINYMHINVSSLLTSCCGAVCAEMIPAWPTAAISLEGMICVNIISSPPAVPGSVLAVPLLRSAGDLQRHPYLYRMLCVDDRIRKLLLLLQD